MRTRLAFLLALGATSPAAARETLGWYGHWGAFRESANRCFARVVPVAGKGGLAVSAAPAAGIRLQVHIDLPRPARPGSLFLTIAQRRFTLVSSELDAWPETARGDLAVVAAMRAGSSAELRGVDRAGGRIRIVFPLAGAPSAIDAALIGCSQR